MLKRVMIVCAILGLIQTGLLAQADLSNAKDLILQEKYEDAKKELNGFLGSKQKNEDHIRYWLGMIEYLSGNYAGAEAAFDDALSNKKNSAINMAGKGMMNMRNNKYTDAYALLEKAQQVSKMKDPDVVFAIADAYLLGGSEEAAKAKVILYDYRTVNDEDPRTYIKLADYYKVQGVPELATKEYEIALEKVPTYVPAMASLGELYYTEGKNAETPEDKARAFKVGYDYANKAVETNPNYASAYRVRAELYLISALGDRYERARNDIQKYLELTGEDQTARIRYAQFLFLTEDYEKSLGLINNLQGEGVQNSVLRRLKGMSLNKLGRSSEAKAAMDDYFANIEEQYTIGLDYEAMGDIYRSMKDLENADANYVKAMQKDSERGNIFEDIAESYAGNAEKILEDGKSIVDAAKAADAKSRGLTKEYREILAKQQAGTITQEDADRAGALKPMIAEAQAEAKTKLNESNKVKDSAIPEYKMEAHYRAKAIEMADPVTMSLYRQLAMAHYKAKDYKAADEAFKVMHGLKEDYMLPYQYRMRCASLMDKEMEPEVNNWLVLPVAEDIVRVFADNAGNLKPGQQQTVLVALEALSLKAFDPVGDNNPDDYNCSGAQEYIAKISAIKPEYVQSRAALKSVSEYCAQ
ncbi:MAG: tetratricopeptide repeat protein [Bacteroidia bacterium]|nr:tetratricopeptide repeat protein [Bacteroidia bacterium]